MKLALAAQVILASATSFAACFLAGAFCAASFDITTWTSDGRFMVALCGIFGGPAALLFYLLERR